MKRKVKEALLTILVFVTCVYLATALVLGTIKIYDGLVGK